MPPTATSTQTPTIRLLAEPSTVAGTYVSPRHRRRAISAHDISDDAATYQRGLHAQERLSDAGLDRDQQHAYMRAINEGASALERLVITCMPLVESLAFKEMDVAGCTVADLIQEGVTGLIKGLRNYQPTLGTKPSNYLAQWIVNEISRAKQGFSNIVAVPTETSQRLKRIHSIRARLSVELQRPPTDAEVMAASADYQQRRRLGPKDRPGSTLSSAQLEEARQLHSRLGGLLRLEYRYRAHYTHNGDDDTFAVREKPAQPLESDSDLTAHHLRPTDALADINAKLLRALIGKAINSMSLPDAQTTVIACRFGLPPFTHDQATIKTSAATAQVAEWWAEQVLTDFVIAFASAGGPLHRMLDTIDTDDIHDLGLGWLLQRLPHHESHLHPFDLPASLRAPQPPHDLPPVVPSRGSGVIAEFRCPTHSNRIFRGLYRSERTTPTTRSCPACGRPSELINTVKPESASR